MGTRAASYGSTTDAGERTRTPEPSSNRMQVDSTWDDMERSGDGQPRVELETLARLCRRSAYAIESQAVNSATSRLSSRIASVQNASVMFGRRYSLGIAPSKPSGR